MGLLDDAIREHLELKRRHGADPAEVAREQHEALDPPADQGKSADASGEAGETLAEDEAMVSGALDQALALDDHAAVPSAADSSPHSEQPGGEETAELDMKAVLEDDVRSAEGPDVAAPPPGQEHLHFDPPTDPGVGK
jgi:hypothetical protein